jgi:hypothetical protein
MKISTLTERQERDPLSWLRTCPECGPDRLMYIKNVLSLHAIRGSSVVHYECDLCGHLEDILID